MAAKKVKGRKRHVLTDTLGLLLRVHVGTADEPDGDGGLDLLVGAQREFPGVEQLWADGAYQGGFLDWVNTVLGWRVVISTKLAGQHGFVPQPQRWVIERTFGWFGRWRRLAKDFEHLPECAEAHLLLASSGLMLNRLARA